MKNQVAKKVAKKLLQINAIKLSPQNPFVWASGLHSPIYCDNRMTLSYPKIRDLIIKKGLKQLAEQTNHFDAIAGVATAGIAHGAILAETLNKPFLYVRSKAKAHGRQNSIEGRLEQGSHILVVEDLISTGKSSIQAVQALRDAGGLPVKVISIFNYGLNIASINFNKAQIEFDSVCCFKELLDVAVKTKYISESEISLIESWQADPLSWSNAQKLKATRKTD
jgi:orotate phosphoribosyltransferase